MATNFDDWCVTTFARTELPTHLTGPHDDPDNDNATNFYEYAVGSDPLTPEGASLQPQMEESSRPRWTLPRNPDAHDVQIEIEFSTDLQTWRQIEEPGLTIRVQDTKYIFTLNEDEDFGFVRARFSTP